MGHYIWPSTHVLQQWKRRRLHALGNISSCRLAVHALLRLGGTLLPVRCGRRNLGTWTQLRTPLANLQLYCQKRLVWSTIHKSEGACASSDGVGWLQRRTRTIPEENSRVERFSQPGEFEWFNVNRIVEDFFHFFVNNGWISKKLDLFMNFFLSFAILNFIFNNSSEKVTLELKFSDLKKKLKIEEKKLLHCKFGLVNFGLGTFPNPFWLRNFQHYVVNSN